MQPFLLSLASTLVALAFVIALAWGLLHLLRGRMLQRAVANGNDDTLRFVRALPVGAKERVVLIDYRSERWMLGVSGGGINVLARWPEVSPPSSVATSPQSE